MSDMSDSAGGKSSILPWQCLASRPVGDFRIFSIRSDIRVNPRTGKPHDFYVIDSVDWVNVIALTPDRKLVMVEQYRHGSNTVELEVPGGMLEVGESDPLAAGVRELREETGYEGDNARVIGRIFPNAAVMSNRCHTLLIENCRCVQPPDLDHGEDLATRLIPLDEVPGMVVQGRIQHALVVVAWYHFELWQNGISARIN